MQQSGANRELLAHELAHTVQQSGANRELLAHELAHVVQQAGANRELLAHELAHVVQQAARTSEPGVVHLIVWDYLGILAPSTVYDRTWDDEVWNQPLRVFRLDFKGGNGATPTRIGNAGAESKEAVNETALTAVLEMLTNMQKSKHDAAMAAIQNAR